MKKLIKVLLVLAEPILLFFTINKFISMALGKDIPIETANSINSEVIASMAVVLVCVVLSITLVLMYVQKGMRAIRTIKNNISEMQEHMEALHTIMKKV